MQPHRDLGAVTSRRNILGGLAAAMAAAAAGSGMVWAHTPTAPGRKIALLDTIVAGTAYYEAARVRRQLRAGDPLVLRRQPENPYDELAIEVFTADGAKLGYVPRADNEPLARLMDAGLAVEAEVVEVATYAIWMSLSLRV